MYTDPRKISAGVHLAKLLVVVGLAWIVGCGEAPPQQAAVHGRVTYRGKPIEQGKIVFHPVAPLKGLPTGADIVNGSYTINENGPVLGKYRVEIQAYRKTGRKIPDIMGDVSIPNRPLVDEMVPLLPAAFNVESTLTADIATSDNTVDFKL